LMVNLHNSKDSWEANNDTDPKVLRTTAESQPLTSDTSNSCVNCDPDSGIADPL
jgi:hypothetical protein